jgi:hypothetical protein
LLAKDVGESAMRRIRAAAAALAIAAAVVTGQARAEPPDAKAERAIAQPASTSLPEAAGVVAGAVLLQAALLGMGLLILFPNQRRRGAAVPQALAPPAREGR